jgi:hypothetical protein
VGLILLNIFLQLPSSFYRSSTGLYLLKYNSIQTALYTFSNTAEAEVGKELLAKSATTLVSQQHAELSKSSFVFIPRSLPKEPRLFHYRAGVTPIPLIDTAWF